jgi:hypothetical protein
MVALKKQVGQRPPLTIEYDRRVDVLHILLGSAVPYEGTGRPRGLELDYAIDSGQPVGATVIGYRRNGWDSDPWTLADRLSAHLRIDPAEIAKAIKRKTRER